MVLFSATALLERNTEWEKKHIWSYPYNWPYSTVAAHMQQNQEGRNTLISSISSLQGMTEFSFERRSYFHLWKYVFINQACFINLKKVKKVINIKDPYIRGMRSKNWCDIFQSVCLWFSVARSKFHPSFNLEWQGKINHVYAEWVSASFPNR